MLICPHCSSENPDQHKFCQACGHSLVEQSCPDCGALVPLQLERCPVCQTRTGTVWYAVCTKPGFIPAADNTAANTAANTATSIAAAPELTAGKIGDSKIGDSRIADYKIGDYLDHQQRYRILEVLPAAVAQADAPEVTLLVLDDQPLQPSPLQLLQRQQTPIEILPYLELQADYHSLAMPDIHDAWEDNGVAVILLADRSSLPLLSEVWADQAVLPLQMLHWLHEMATMWALLEPYQACRSLLRSDNLRVDEDYLLCLQRLYFAQANQSPEIRSLADLWQQLFHQSQRTYPAEMALLQHELGVGKIASAEALQARIEAIAMLLQTRDATSSDQTEPLTGSIDASCNTTDAETAAEAASFSTEATLPPLPDNLLQADSEDSTVPFSLPGMGSAIDETAWLEAAALQEGSSENDELPTIVLPMRLVSLEDAGRTDVGRQRDHNEDCFNIRTEHRKIESPQGRLLSAKGLYILCDGMGGHAGGEVASAMAVETLSQYFAAQWQDKLPGEATIREGILQANRAIYELNQSDARSGSGRMGTTLVLVLIQDAEAAIAHVGDSRLYRFSRSRGLEQLTTDHEVGQREIQRGVEPAIAYARPDAYQLTQALGPRDGNFINPDVKFFELNEDSLLLLCSDGLSDNDLLEKHWQTHLEPMLRSQMPLEQGVNQLIDLANEQNGHDNVTALVIRTIVRPNVELLGQKPKQTQQEG